MLAQSSLRVGRRVAIVVALLASGALPVSAQSKTTPPVVGLDPAEASSELESAGFAKIVYVVDGVAVASMEEIPTGAFVVGTLPGAYVEAGTESVIVSLSVGSGPGFTVNIKNHTGWEGGPAMRDAAGIGYELVEGDPERGAMPISPEEERTVESYVDSGKSPGFTVVRGDAVGVVLVQTLDLTLKQLAAIVVVTLLVGVAAGYALGKATGSKT